jgi:dTMP kinase
MQQRSIANASSIAGPEGSDSEVSGRFIVLEGVDGVGKTTQIALLSAWMEASGMPHAVVREPGGTPVGEAIREVVLGRTDLDISPEAELLLILAARAALVHGVIRPALQEGRTVLADRFALSTLAYQVHGRGLDEDGVRRAIDLATGGLRPDLYVVLDLPLEQALERTRLGRGSPDRIEQEGEGFRHSVRQAYLALAGSEPGVEVLRAHGAPEEVHGRIRDLLEARFPQSFSSRPVGVRGRDDR